ncbi:MAG: DEAD/DEAH box helicase, partial [Armatimonadetes bacterium]|nr:DEAD/DEAH box helicase [Armatimonadota bacterium]
MMKLEDLKRDAVVSGILPHESVTIIDVTWHGNDAVEVTYKDARGQAGNELLFRDDEARLDLAASGKPWRVDVDGGLMKLAAEARRIQLGYLFDPFLAVHTSMIDPLPHQITAVYEKMLPRQPLRFLLADDPGSGKTIMAGLYIKELMIRGDVERCLVVCPGGLAEQWQDELWQRFQLPFEILTNDRIEAARTGNALAEMSLVIARLDKLARDEALQAKLDLTDWDLIVVDEAHKMSASYFGNEVKYTKRYRLGQKLSKLTRHFLLMTATPHNGKETDFQLFMALLDPDRFEGKYREGYSTDVRDMMRRMVKEELLKFDGTPLFPERRAYTVPYKLSDLEAKLYQEVTDYVREEFNRAERLQNDGRKGTVGFALTILQRRLASSPEAIYQSLKRRRERLESRLREMQLISRGLRVGDDVLSRYVDWSEEDVEDLQDELPAEELESLEEQVLDQATAAQTVEELEAEIRTLKRLEKLARAVRNSGQDRKWEELSRLLQDEEAMFDASGRRRKLVIFTEHRDTLTYLADRIRTLLGRPEAVVTIHGGVKRDERRLVQERFTQNEEVSVLVATDAAGEGINLQRAHLMINYDLPWNPNRLEQRFGRIHRIGQTEVCHLWNLVAEETREGDVYLTLLRKLERERATLGGAVFDVLGKAIPGAELRRLMIEAIRYGDRPEVRARLLKKVEGALDQEHLRKLLSQDVLAHEVMDPRQVFAIRHLMERMEARRLQPHYIQAFFLAAFRSLGGIIRERERGRFQISRVPAPIRQRGRLLGHGDHILRSYERICFEKALRQVPGKPPAEFIAPGHPLLEAVTSLIYEQYSPLLKQGAVLVDESDNGETPRALVCLENSIRDARVTDHGQRRIISRRMQFVEIPLEGDGEARNAGYAPYLDYRPLEEDERALVAEVLDKLAGGEDVEQRAMGYAIQHLALEHLEEVRAQREPLIEKTMAAVKDRLTREIIYWNNRAMELQMR